MNIGYACKTIAVVGTQISTVRLSHATAERLYQCTAANLQALKRILLYNIENGIHLFRISSDIIPLATYPGKQIAWRSLFAEELAKIAGLIADHHLRVSMHPGQYTVLNSPDADVRRRAVEDLQYHADFLDAVAPDAQHKMVLHIGGVYGDKPAAAKRFADYYQTLGESIQRRLVIENDDVSYTIADVLAISGQCGIPVVFDNLHHQVLPDDRYSVTEWLQRCAKTWKLHDGAQKIHYSQQAPGKRIGSHSETIELEPFLAYYRFLHAIQPDIMLEVKDKNLSAVKCMNAAQRRDQISPLEKEWSRHKYAVLEHSPSYYLQIRVLLREHQPPLTIPFYALLEQAQAQPVTVGHAVNALQHVWGYFKTVATAPEKEKFQKKLEDYETGKISLASVKKFLWKLVENYHQDYLQQAYYYFIDLQEKST